MLKGYYLRILGKDCFFETTAKNRTNTLAIDFLNKIQNSINRYFAIDENTVDYIKKSMQPAFCEIKTLSNGRQYYNIFGENFGGCGTFVDDNETVIVN